MVIYIFFIWLLEMASRFSGKTYGRKSTASKQDSAFDEMVKDSKANANFASGSQQNFVKSSKELEARKRPAPNDTLFSNPFDFDSDDEGPSKPKRGQPSYVFLFYCLAVRARVSEVDLCKGVACRCYQ